MCGVYGKLASGYLETCPNYLNVQLAFIFLVVGKIKREKGFRKTLLQVT